MFGRIPLFKLVFQVGSHSVEVFLDTAVHAVTFNDHLGEVVVENVSHHADRHVRLALQQLRTLAVQEFVTLGGDTFPLAHQAFKVLGNRLFGSAFRSGTNDHAHVFRSNLRHDVLEAGTFALAELTTHARHATGWHEHQETARKSDLRGQSCALVPDRILSDLHEHRVSRLEREFDAARLAFQTCGIPVHLTRIQHAVARLTDVYERGLHARQHVLHATKIDVAHGGDFLNVGHVMLDKHIVFDHGNLRVAFALAHNHQAIHMLAASQEILFHELALTAAFAAIVTAALLLGLKSSRTLDIGDLVNVLLLAGTAYEHLFLLLGLRAATAAATTTGHRALFLVILLTAAARLTFGVLLLSFVSFLTTAMATTATTGARRLLVIIIVTTIATCFVVDRRVRDIVEDQILFNLLDLGRSSTLLRVQTTGTTGLARSAFLIVFRIIITIVTLVTFTVIVFGTLFVSNVTITTATATGRTILTLRIVMILHIAIIARFTGIVTIVIGPVTGIRSRRQNRLLKQQRHHRTRIMTDLMAFRQHINRIKRAFFKRFLIAEIIDSAATATTRHLVILVRISNGTTTATRTILIPLILDLHRAAATSTRRLLIGNLTNIIVGPGRTMTATSRARHTIGIAIITGNSDVTGIMRRLRNRQLRLFE